MTELLVGTRKGLFVLDGEPGSPFEITRRAFVGEPVDYAMRDPRSGRLFAAVTSPFWGPRIWFADDLAEDWQPARGVALPKGGTDALKRIWVIQAGEADGRIYAGGDPGVLFESRDDGVTWELNRALWAHPTRPRWRRDSGGLSVHSIAPWAGDPDRLAVAISAAGVWLTEDGGATWRHGNEGIVADYLPAETRADAIDLCVHHIERAPQRPERLFMQFHGGVYRSDDAGASWTDIAAGLPHDFGFSVALDPADPDSAFVIPVTTSDRVTDGRVVVWETRDAGATWTPRDRGLPQRDAYLSVLRQAFAATGEGADLELYFGATAGEIFGSSDAGRSWFTVAQRLPAIASVRAA
ncbi:MAG: WD40/YVTN/BNR-like repeat-containing protein [Solirubrobacteraceae bacterium]